MHYLYSWIVFIGTLLRYLLFRLGLGERPSFEDHPEETVQVAHHIFRHWRRLKIEGAEHCPKEDPAIFASNHIKLSDPIDGWPAIYHASAQQIITGFMMRDDFFEQWFWRLLPFNLDDIVEMLGAVRISRENFQLRQLKPLLARLGKPGSFLMYPNGTRSRSGMVMEYRDGFDEPGNVSFFVSHAQRRDPDLDVAVSPMTRTVNPASGRNVIVFGKALYLKHKAHRAEQRELDYALAERIAELIEINVLHLICTLIYLFCLHSRGEALSSQSLRKQVRWVLENISGRHIDPAAGQDLDQEINLVMRYLKDKKVIQAGAGDQILLQNARILSAPPLTSRYRKDNPVKYQVNQILHFPDVLTLLEEAAPKL